MLELVLACAGEFSLTLTHRKPNEMPLAFEPIFSTIEFKFEDEQD